MEMSALKREELLRKANVLKRYEVYGYQVAYFLLENEALAVQAVSQALIELLQDEEFFGQPPPLQKQKTKQVFMKQSLLAKKSSLQTSVYTKLPVITFR
ncbi:hypothetical protein [Paenibacillus sp. sgz302251]|uniref:hypothetical protein n=1 Tax=Paenibacillus sp. sgz302251 TaxID=3414493 RepID=UPI003C7D3A88